jgi:hypothetical protein
MTKRRQTDFARIDGVAGFHFWPIETVAMMDLHDWQTMGRIAVVGILSKLPSMKQETDKRSAFNGIAQKLLESLGWGSTSNALNA